MALLKDVTVLFSNVLNKDDFTQKYQIVVEVNEEQAADAEAAGLKIKEREYDGKTQKSIAFKTKFKPRIVGKVASQDYDLEGSELGRGSSINVQYKERKWQSPTKQTGTSYDLVAVQVVDRQAVSASEFDDVNEFGSEDDGDI